MEDSRPSRMDASFVAVFQRDHIIHQPAALLNTTCTADKMKKTQQNLARGDPQQQHHSNNHTSAPSGLGTVTCCGPGAASPPPHILLYRYH